jgi:hypothetical protein
VGVLRTRGMIGVGGSPPKGSQTVGVGGDLQHHADIFHIANGCLTDWIEVA